MNFKSIITAAIALLVSTACSGGAKQEKVMNKDGKALVVFFSHAGDNYAVGNIEVGNTKIVTDYITELTGAEQFEIVTTSTTEWLIHHSSIWQRKKQGTASCPSMRVTLICQSTIRCLLVDLYGGAPIRK